MKINAYAALKEKSLLERFTYDRIVGKNQIAISIKYCSCTRGDIRFIDNHWKDTRYPFVPGLEIIGVVEAVADDVNGISVGDIVGVGYQVSSCFSCEYCLSGKEQFCLRQTLIPVHEFGGFADKIFVDYRFAFVLPHNLYQPGATPLLCSGLTTYSAIKYSSVQKGMRVGVIGIGSLGHLAVQFLAKIGCEVTAFSHTLAKLDMVKKLGGDEYILQDDIQELTKHERMYDFLLFTSSEAVNYGKFLKLLKPEGILCFVGLPEHEVSFRAELLADFARRHITGNYIGSREDMKEMLEFSSKNNITATCGVFAMEHVNDAIAKMRQNEIPFSTVLQNTEIRLS